jgi:hypothetical protein
MNSIEQSVSEEILLYSNDEARQPDEAEFKHVTGHLLQDSKWKMQRKLFRIYDDKYLSIKEHTLTSAKKYWFPLAHLDPEPEHCKSLNWRLGLGAFITALVAFLVIDLRITTDLGQWATFATASITLLLIATLAQLAWMIFTSTNHFVFRSCYGRYTIATVLNNLPSKPECQQFIEMLIERIEQNTRRSGFHDKRQKLAAELSELRRLRDSAAIHDEEYEQAKDNILSQH